jgi:zinc carboxypeptidase
MGPHAQQEKGSVCPEHTMFQNRTPRSHPLRPNFARATLLAAIIALAVNPHAQTRSAIPTPSEFLKINVGGDGVLATYEQIVSYFRALDPLSDRITVRDLGPTTMGHPYIVAIVTSPENQQKLEQYREINNRLYDPRKTTEEQARALIAEGKTIVAMQMSIHSTEVGAAQMSMELLHRFATENTARMKAVLDNAIVILSPSHNPDGTQMVAEWNQKTVGTKFEGSNLPFLYHKYVGHDDNRDWYMFTQKESQITVSKIWNTWHPHISYDMHQMGATAARIFMPPYVDPYDPNIDPILRAETNALGSSMAAELLGQGKDGVLIHGIYDAWTPARLYTNYHGGVRFLTEVASARLASPMTLTFTQLGRGIGYDAKVVAWNFPRPWRGGTWRLRDIMDYEHAAADALLDHAVKYREMWLANFYRVNRNAIGRRDPETGAEKPFAIVIPSVQKDVASAYQMMAALQLGDVEISRAKAPFTAGGRDYPAGSHVILMAQPASAFAKTLTEVQHYPDLRQYPGGPPQRPYDVTAYTMPLLMGVETVTVQQPFDVAKADLELVTAPFVAPGGAVIAGPAKKAYVFAHDNAGIMAANRLMKEGARLQWSSAPVTAGGKTLEAGAFVVPVDGQKNVHTLVTAVARALPVQAYALNAAPPATPFHAPRVGLYKSYQASMDEGWTRWIFEQWNMPYTSLENKDVRAGGLRGRFDAIVLPDQAAASIIDGFRAGTMPDEYVGGIGADGVGALRQFVEAGGTLIALDSATELPIEQFKLPVKDVLAGLSGGGQGGGDSIGPSSAAFYAPGSIVKTLVDTSSPIAAGSDSEGIAWFEQSPTFDVSGNAKAIVRYPAQGSVLLSGWLLGGEKLNGKAAVVEAPLGSGRVILFGFRPQYRAQTWSTFKLLFNAIYYAAMESPAPAQKSSSQSSSRSGGR